MRVKFKSAATGRVKILNRSMARNLQKRGRGEIVDVPHQEELTHNGRPPFSATDEGRALGRGQSAAPPSPDELRAQAAKLQARAEALAASAAQEDAPAPAKAKAAKAPADEPEAKGDDDDDETDTPEPVEPGAPVPDFRTMSWSKLQKEASSLNIYTSGMSKPETIDALEKFHGVGDVAG